MQHILSKNKSMDRIKNVFEPIKLKIQFWKLIVTNFLKILKLNIMLLLNLTSKEVKIPPSPMCHCNTFLKISSQIIFLRSRNIGNV